MKPDISEFIEKIKSLEKKNFELKTENYYLKTIFEYAPDAIFIFDIKNTIIDCNIKACEISGYSYTELINTNYLKLFNSDIHPNFEIEKRNSNRTNEHIFITKNGNEIKVENFIRALPNNYFQLLIRETSHQKHVEEKLIESESKYRLLFENMTNGFALHKIIVDDANNPIDYKYLEANPAFEKLTGIPVNNIAGKTVLELIPELEKYWIETFGKVALTGEHLYYENYVKELGRYYDTLVYSPKKEYFAVIFSDITEKKKIQDELYIKALLLENAQEGIILADEFAKIIFFNKKFTELTGYNSEELKNTSLHALEPNEFAEKINENISKIFIYKELIFESAFLQKNKKIIPIEVHSKIISYQNKNYILSFIKDITEKKQHEKQVTENQNRLKFVLANSFAAIFHIDKFGKIILADGKAFSTIQIDPTKLVGLSAFDLYHHYPKTVEEIKKALAGQVVTYSSEYNQVPFETIISPVFDEHGKVDGAIGISLDITERKKAEAIIQQQIKELENKNAEMERFTYTVSHDLRSPLITIKGFIGLLIKDIKAGKYNLLETDMLRVEKAAEKMQLLLEDLLELSRIGRIVNASSVFSITEVVKEVQELLQGAILKNNIKLVYNPSMPVISADKFRVREVLQNLIENSIKFMGTIANPVIEINYKIENGIPVFFVKDNGIGIDSKYFTKIFGLFEKLDTKTEGTGIGLAIVKRIIEVHGGKIWVESDGLGKGSSFYFTFSNNPKTD